MRRNADVRLRELERRAVVSGRVDDEDRFLRELRRVLWIQLGAASGRSAWLTLERLRKILVDNYIAPPRGTTGFWQRFQNSIHKRAMDQLRLLHRKVRKSRRYDYISLKEWAVEVVEKEQELTHEAATNLVNAEVQPFEDEISAYLREITSEFGELDGLRRWVAIEAVAEPGEPDQDFVRVWSIHRSSSYDAYRYGHRESMEEAQEKKTFARRLGFSTRTETVEGELIGRPRRRSGQSVDVYVGLAMPDADLLYEQYEMIRYSEFALGLFGKVRFDREWLNMTDEEIKLRAVDGVVQWGSYGSVAGFEEPEDVISLRRTARSAYLRARRFLREGSVMRAGDQMKIVYKAVHTTPRREWTGRDDPEILKMIERWLAYLQKMIRSDQVQIGIVPG